MIIYSLSIGHISTELTIPFYGDKLYSTREKAQKVLDTFNLGVEAAKKAGQYKGATLVITENIVE